MKNILILFFLFAVNAQALIINQFLQPDGTSLTKSGSTLSVKNGGITRAKLGTLGEQVSSSSGANAGLNGNAPSGFDITNLSVTITTTGRPVIITLVSDGSGNDATFQFSGSISKIRLLRDATEISRIGTNTTAILPASFTHIDSVAAGTYTYKMQVINNGSTITYVNYLKLVAYELF